jgi:hypothetical protein
MVIAAFFLVLRGQRWHLSLEQQFLQDHLRAALSSPIWDIHLLSSHSWQHLTHGGGLGLLLQEGVLGLGTACWAFWWMTFNLVSKVS